MGSVAHLCCGTVFPILHLSKHGRCPKSVRCIYIICVQYCMVVVICFHVFICISFFIFHYHIPFPYSFHECEY